MIKYSIKMCFNLIAQSSQLIHKKNDALDEKKFIEIFNLLLLHSRKKLIEKERNLSTFIRFSKHFPFPTIIVERMFRCAFIFSVLLNA